MTGARVEYLVTSGRAGRGTYIGAAPDLAVRTGAPGLLHPDDLPLWKQSYSERLPDGEPADGRSSVAGTSLTVLHTPGHAPGAICLCAEESGTVFTGDRLPTEPVADPPAGDGRADRPW